MQLGVILLLEAEDVVFADEETEERGNLKKEIVWNLIKGPRKMSNGKGGGLWKGIEKFKLLDIETLRYIKLTTELDL